MARRCNTPRKLRFPTLRAALARAEQLRTPRGGEQRAARPLVPYLCRSGRHFHLCSAEGSKRRTDASC
jgi:hypothetical protein